MAPLERLFALEIEFHRRLRIEAPGTADASALHTSYALQAGYEPLLRRIGGVTIEQVDQEVRNLSLTNDPRDVLAARDSIARLLGYVPTAELWVTLAVGVGLSADSRSHRLPGGGYSLSRPVLAAPFP
jgi:hypothetical protein